MNYLTIINIYFRKYDKINIIDEKEKLNNLLTGYVESGLSDSACTTVVKEEMYYVLVACR